MTLQQIVSSVSAKLEMRKHSISLRELKRLAERQPPPLDFLPVLLGDHVKLIAEIKGASPSRGIIRQDFHPADVARIFAHNGASAISVLTEEECFRGDLSYLSLARKGIDGKPIPVLRKDFIFDPYQVYEARAHGADGLLLIVAILSPDKLQQLLELSHQLGMSCLVEVHNEDELEIALHSKARMIGINNRDLSTFTVDIATTGRLRPLIPYDRVVVSESGIRTRADMLMMEKWGANAVLIGEALMSAPDIAGKMRELLHDTD